MKNINLSFDWCVKHQFLIEAKFEDKKNTEIYASNIREINTRIKRRVTREILMEMWYKQN